MSHPGETASHSRDGKGRPRGFDLSIADQPPVADKYLCKICRYILRKPMQGFCGHRFCHACVLYRLTTPTKKDSKYCPACLEDVERDELSAENLLDKDKIFSDNAIKRDATNVAVHCINPGCPWKANLRLYEEHESACNFKSFECVCGSLVLLSKEKQHLASECIMRKVSCQYCAKTVIFKLLKGHLEECEQYPFDCKYCGKKGILRKLEEHHYTNECKVKLSKCQICSKLVAQGTVGQHIEQNVGTHLEKLGVKLHEFVVEVRDKFDNLAHPIQESEIRQSIENITSRLQKIETVQLATAEEHAGARASRPNTESHKLDEAAGGAGAAPEYISDLRKQIESLGQRVSVFDSIGSVLNQEIMGIVHRMEQFEARGEGGAGVSSTEIEELRAKMSQLEVANSAKDTQIAELTLQLRNQENTTYDGTFLWKIADVNRRRSEARAGNVGSIYSQPFYTGRTGYKMCARLYFNGDGMGRNTHMSLYFVVMKGDFDNLLRWPFKQKVTLQLLDFNRREHVSDAFRPDPASTSFRQPQTNMNIASGCPLFCQVSRLDNPGASTYIKDDTMFVKIVVDTAEI